jgi:hypothetical protein
VPQEERPEEQAARHLIDRVAGIRLEFADTHGSVDYLYTDGVVAGAVEVTRFTRQDLRASTEAWARGAEAPYESRALTHSWWVGVANDKVRHKELGKRIEPHLQVLEGFPTGKWFFAQVWEGDPGIDVTLRSAIRGLKAEHVDSAQWIEFADDPVSRIHISPHGGWMAGKADSALDMVESFIRDHPDNLAKLSASAAERRHLFIRIDFHTIGNVRTNVEGELPTRRPDLPESVTDVWVVNEQDQGWYWSGSSGEWQRVEPED